MQKDPHASMATPSSKIIFIRILPSFPYTAVLRYLLHKKNEPELSLYFLVTSYDGQGQVYKRKIIHGADSEKTHIWVNLYCKIEHLSL